MTQETRSQSHAFTSFLVLSYPHLAPSPGIHRMFNGSDIRLFIIAVAPRRVLWDNLLNRHPMPLFDVEREDERVPVHKAILPTLHLGIPSPIEIDTRAIRNAALIAQRERFACFPCRT